MPTPTYTGSAYTLLAKLGYTYGLVERNNGRIKSDFCGFADIIAFRPMRFADLRANRDLLRLYNFFCGSLAVQVCRYTDLAEHIHKVVDGSPREPLENWLSCGNRFEIWAFPTPKDKRVKGKHYQPKFRRFDLLDFKRDGRPTTSSPSESHGNLLMYDETELTHLASVIEQK